MASEREILEMNARAVAIMMIYRGGPERPGRDTKRLIAELREVAAWLLAARLAEADLRRLVFEPVRAELLERYGPEEGQRTYNEFSKILRRKLVALAKLLPDRASSRAAPGGQPFGAMLGRMAEER